MLLEARRAKCRILLGSQNQNMIIKELGRQRNEDGLPEAKQLQYVGLSVAIVDSEGFQDRFLIERNTLIFHDRPTIYPLMLPHLQHEYSDTAVLTQFASWGINVDIECLNVFGGVQVMEPNRKNSHVVMDIRRTSMGTEVPSQTAEIIVAQNTKYHIVTYKEILEEAKKTVMNSFVQNIFKRHRAQIFGLEQEDLTYVTKKIPATYLDPYDKRTHQYYLNVHSLWNYLHSLSPEMLSRVSGKSPVKDETLFDSSQALADEDDHF